jgi:hypothetical protein
MVSKRRAKKAAQHIKERWKKIFPPQPKAVLDGFIIPCQAMVISDAERLEVVSVPERNKPARLGVRSALIWFRSIGICGVLLGGLGVMQPQFFWLSIGFVCAGLALLAIDLYFEPGLSNGFKVSGQVLIFVALGIFSAKVVFVSAPINFNSLASKSDYALAANLGGITWRSVFIELDLIVTNPTDGNYDNAELLVRPDYPIAAIAQLSNLSDVSFEDNLGVTNRVTIEDLSAKVGAPMVFLATDAGYKVHCGRIPPNNSLRIVMAVVDIKKSQASDPNKPFTVPSNVSIDDFFMVQTFDTKGDKSTYWYGSPKNLSAYAPGAKPHKITVRGFYTASNRKRNINQDLIVNSMTRELVNK